MSDRARPQSHHFGLNTAVIAARVAALGISERDFGIDTGLRLADIEAGLPPRAITLEHLARLADLLELDPTELLTIPGHPEQTSTAPETTDTPTARGEPSRDDAATVYATLTLFGRFTPDELATSLDWSTRRLDKALRILTERLATQPVQLTVDDEVCEALAITARPGGLPGTLADRLEATRLARHPLTEGEARTMLTLIGDEIDPDVDERDLQAREWRWLPTQFRSARHARLAHRGLATPIPNSGWVTPPTVHPDVLFALDLAPSPAQASPTAPSGRRRRRPRGW
jgi:hypothetical protein